MTLYRLLLLAFPRRVRREFGGDMERKFDEQLRVARQDGASRIRLVAMATADALRHGFGERFGNPRRARAPRVRQAHKWRIWMQAFVQDLRYAVRLLVAQPAVTLLPRQRWPSASAPMRRSFPR